MNTAYLNGYLYKQAGNTIPDFWNAAKNKQQASNTEAWRESLVKHNRERRAEAAHIDPNAPKTDLTSIRGYDKDTGELDMMEYLRGTYGPHLEGELNKASEYNKKHKIGIDMKTGYARKVPLIAGKGEEGSNYRPLSDTIRVNNKNKDLGTMSPRLRAINGYMYSKGNRSPLENLNETVLHEAAHSADLKLPFNRSKVDRLDSWDDQVGTKLYEDWNSEVYEKPRKNKADFSDLSPAAMEQLRKDMWAENQRKAAIRKVSGPAPTTDQQSDVRGKNIYHSTTYPERSSVETIPPLAALQQHLFKTTGKRIESPAAYNAYMQNLDNMPTEARWEYIQRLPEGVQRLINYRDIMRHNGDIRKMRHNPNNKNKPIPVDSHKRLIDYDNMNARMIPAVAQNRMNIGNLPT
jgi:hypothetical protein